MSRQGHDDPDVQTRKGWRRVRGERGEWGEWYAYNEPEEPDRAASVEVLNGVRERTSAEMLDEVLRLTNRQLAGLSKIGEAGMLNDLELQQLGRVHQIVLAQMRVKPQEDPLAQRDGESNEAYLERLESMKGNAK
jgi:hypothetical protein